MGAIKLYIGILTIGTVWLFSDVREVYTLFVKNRQAKHYFIKEEQSLEEESKKRLKIIDNTLALKLEGERKMYATYLTLKNESVDSIFTVVDKYAVATEGYQGFDKQGMHSFNKEKLISADLVPVVEKIENRLNYNGLAYFLINNLSSHTALYMEGVFLQKDFFNDSIYLMKEVGPFRGVRLLVEINGQAIDNYQCFGRLTIKKTKEIDIKYTILTLEDERTRIDTFIKRRRVVLEF